MKTTFGVILIAFSIFMLLGFFGSEADYSLGVKICTFLLGIALPAVCGVGLISPHFKLKSSLAETKPAATDTDWSCLANYKPKPNVVETKPTATGTDWSCLANYKRKATVAETKPALWKQPSESGALNCDVCSATTSWEEGTAYTADEFRLIVSKGFEPNQSAITMMTVAARVVQFAPNAMRISRDQVIAQWKGLVAQDTTGWLLCHSCAVSAAKYISKQSETGPSGHKLTENNKCLLSPIKPVSSPLVTAPKGKVNVLNDEMKSSGSNNAEPSVSQLTEPHRYRDYREVPWHRKSGSNSFLLLLNLLTAGFIPGTLLVCIFLLTGDVYYKQKDNNGNLKTWAYENKIVAVVLLLGNSAYLAYLFMR